MKIHRFPSFSELDVVYVPGWMGKLALPVYRRKENEYSVCNGGYRVSMISPSEWGLPYGAYPRLLLAYLATSAKITERPTVRLGSSQAAFMRSIGRTSTGGQKGSLRALKAQSMRLLSTHMYYEKYSGNQWEWENYSISDRGMLMWHPNSNSGCWDAEVELSEKFFGDVVSHAFPVWRKVIFDLARKPTQFDIYCWLVSRSASLSRRTHVRWGQLSGQFGNSIQKQHHFRYCFRRSFGAVIEQYPEVRFRFSKHGLILWPYPPHVPMTSRYCG